MTIRIEDELKERLERLAALTQCSRTRLAEQAVREFVDANAHGKQAAVPAKKSTRKR
jgi:predicted transcriptional regulator